MRVPLVGVALLLLMAAGYFVAQAPPSVLGGPGAPLPSQRPTPPPSHHCESATLGALLVCDSDGYVCERFHVAEYGCCSEMRPRRRYTCVGCAEACCARYENCVSCCLGRDAETGPGPLDRCADACRTNSASLDETGRQYRDPDHRYCWARPSATPSTSPSPSAPAGTRVEWLEI